MTNPIEFQKEENSYTTRFVSKFDQFPKTTLQKLISEGPFLALLLTAEPKGKAIKIP